MSTQQVDTRNGEGVGSSRIENHVPQKETLLDQYFRALMLENREFGFNEAMVHTLEFRSFKDCIALLNLLDDLNTCINIETLHFLTKCRTLPQSKPLHAL